jgi:hypothetical protein
MLEEPRRNLCKPISPISLPTISMLAQDILFWDFVVKSYRWPKTFDKKLSYNHLYLKDLIKSRKSIIIS